MFYLEVKSGVVIYPKSRLFPTNDQLTWHKNTLIPKYLPNQKSLKP